MNNKRLLLLTFFLNVFSLNFSFADAPSSTTVTVEETTTTTNMPEPVKAFSIVAIIGVCGAAIASILYGDTTTKTTSTYSSTTSNYSDYPSSSYSYSASATTDDLSYVEPVYPDLKVSKPKKEKKPKEKKKKITTTTITSTPSPTYTSSYVPTPTYKPTYTNTTSYVAPKTKKTTTTSYTNTKDFHPYYAGENNSLVSTKHKKTTNKKPYYEEKDDSLNAALKASANKGKTTFENTPSTYSYVPSKKESFRVDVPKKTTSTALTPYNKNNSVALYNNETSLIPYNPNDASTPRIEYKKSSSSYSKNNSGANYNNSSSNGMTVEEAKTILGLADGYTKQDLDRTYRRKALTVHPDKGGSKEEIQKVNNARDLLDQKLGN